LEIAERLERDFDGNYSIAGRFKKKIGDFILGFAGIFNISTL